MTDIIEQKAVMPSSMWPLLNAAYDAERIAIHVAKARRGDDLEPPLRIPIGTKVDIRERADGRVRECKSDGEPVWLAGRVAYTSIECLGSDVIEARYGFERLYTVLVDGEEELCISEGLALKAFGDAYMPKPVYRVDDEFVAYVGSEQVTFRVAWGGRRDRLPYPIPLELKGGIRGTSDYDVVYIVECAGQLAGVVTEMGLYRLIHDPCIADVTVKAFPTSLSVYLTLCGEGVRFPLTTHSGKWLHPSFEQLLAASPAVLPPDVSAAHLQLGRVFYTNNSWYVLASEMVNRRTGWKQWMVWRMRDGALTDWIPQDALLKRLRQIETAQQVEVQRVS
jgi:hypothetical protein